MRTSNRARRGAAGLTLIEVVVMVVLVAAVAALLLPALSRPREETIRHGCRNNLNRLARGMATYLNEHGDNRWFSCPLGRGLDPDDYNGAEWLASLYWTGVVPDPGVFLCPDSGDTNEEGVDLGTRVAAATFGSQTVGYAGMHYYSQADPIRGVPPGAIDVDYPPNRPMASDDTQGDINHGTLTNGGMNVLFFDSHVEFRMNTELDLKRAVGDTSPDALLTELAN
jgi:prepilin-type processing-associated H-X9-DG protein